MLSVFVIRVEYFKELVQIRVQVVAIYLCVRTDGRSELVVAVLFSIWVIFMSVQISLGVVQPLSTLLQSLANPEFDLPGTIASGLCIEEVAVPICCEIQLAQLLCFHIWF